MVIISDCLSEDGSSILPHIAKFLYPVSLMVRTLAFQVGNTGSIPVQDAKFMRWNGLLAGFEARSRRVQFPLGAPSFEVTLQS